MPEPPVPSRPGGPTEPAPPAAAVAALARQVERIERSFHDADLDGLRGRVVGLGSALAGLAEQVAELADAGEPERPAPSWLWPGGGFTAGAAAALLDQLVEWADRVYLRFPDGQLPECWLWHADVVEELVWLWKAWEAAYRGPRASVQRAGDWHDRLRPGVSRRIGAAGDCSLREHLAPSPRAGVPAADAVPAIAAWAADPAGSPPAPTGAQVLAADAALNRAAGRRR